VPCAQRAPGSDDEHLSYETSRTRSG
jgi:hypothetical protein